MKSIAKIWRDPNDPKYQFNKMDTEKNDSIASWKHDSSESNCSQRHEELKRSPKIACSSTVAVPINKKNIKKLTIPIIPSINIDG
jgi:hypothetical protein